MTTVHAATAAPVVPVAPVTPPPASVEDPRLLADIVQMLVALAERGSQPREWADAALAGLRERWPRHALRLVRDRDTGDGSVSHDVLIRDAAGTVSVAYSAHPATPWPLRGAIRHADSVLLRVDDTQLRVEDALAALDSVWNVAPVLTRLVDTAIVRNELDREPAIVDDQQRQEATEAFRRAKGLLTAEATRQWLHDTGLGLSGFTYLVERTASMHALRRRIASGRIDDWLVAHAGEFDTLTVAWVEGTDTSLAGDEEQVRATVASHVQSGRCAGVTRLRSDAAPASLGAAGVGEVVTAEIAGITATVIVLRREQDSSEEATRAARERAEQALFDEWLVGARDRASVQWCWLDVERTGRAQ